MEEQNTIHSIKWNQFHLYQHVLQKYTTETLILNSQVNNILIIKFFVWPSILLPAILYNNSLAILLKNHYSEFIFQSLNS